MGRYEHDDRKGPEHDAVPSPMVAVYDPGLDTIARRLRLGFPVHADTAYVVASHLLPSDSSTIQQQVKALFASDKVLRTHHPNNGYCGIEGALFRVGRGQIQQLVSKLGAEISDQQVMANIVAIEELFKEKTPTTRRAFSKFLFGEPVAQPKYSLKTRAKRDILAAIAGIMRPINTFMNATMNDRGFSLPSEAFTVYVAPNLTTTISFEPALESPVTGEVSMASHVTRQFPYTDFLVAGGRSDYTVDEGILNSIRRVFDLPLPELAALVVTAGVN
jgi:hypothetical protein